MMLLSTDGNPVAFFVTTVLRQFEIADTQTLFGLYLVAYRFLRVSPPPARHERRPMTEHHPSGASTPTRPPSKTYRPGSARRPSSSPASTPFASTTSPGRPCATSSASPRTATAATPSPSTSAPCASPGPPQRRSSSRTRAPASSCTRASPTSPWISDTGLSARRGRTSSRSSRAMSRISAPAESRGYRCFSIFPGGSRADRRDPLPVARSLGRGTRLDDVAGWCSNGLRAKWVGERLAALSTPALSCSNAWEKLHALEGPCCEAFGYRVRRPLNDLVGDISRWLHSPVTWSDCLHFGGQRMGQSRSVATLR